MTEHDINTLAPECVDPDVGADLHLLDTEALDSDRRRLLQDHLAVCDCCRLRTALEERFATALREGDLDAPATITPLPSRRRVPGFVGAWGGFAMAAGLALMIILPPTAPDEGLSRSADAGRYFVRPVEGEVLADHTPVISWHGVDGASGYRIVVESADGGYRHEQMVETASYEIPDDASLPDGERVRAYLYSIPEDLGPPQGQSVTFRTGNALDVAAHRATAAPLAARLLAGLGALAAAAWVVLRGRSG